MPIENQIAIIFAASKGILDDIEQYDVGNFETKLLSYLDASHREILDSIKNTGEINDDTNSKLLKAIEDFKSGYKS